jgi:hypothetical protein
MIPRLYLRPSNSYSFKSLPSNKILPSVGSYNLANNFTNVVFPARFRLPKPVFLRVKGKAQISICPSIGIAILEAYILEHKTRFMGFGKVKAFWFWVILGLISKNR